MCVCLVFFFWFWFLIFLEEKIRTLYEATIKKEGEFENEEGMQPGGSVDLRLPITLSARGRDGIERY